MEKLAGYIDSIVYAHPENGFTVAKLKEKNKFDLTYIVGHMPSIQPGETVEIEGKWVFHPKHGKQFEISSYQVSYPADVLGIQKYLESGLIKGIGPSFAKKIVDKFQENTLQTIDETPDRLLEIQGIGEKKIASIKLHWDKQKSIRHVMIFLRSHEVSPAFAQKIYKTYGDESIEKVKENPYQLAKDIFGIGFKIADKIALKLGFALHSEKRIEAGIEYVLWELTGDGHTCYPQNQLLFVAAKILEIESDLIAKQIERLAAEEKIILLEHGIQDSKEPFIWLKPLYYYEQGIANELNRLIHSDCALRQIDSAKAVDWIQKELNIQLAMQQQAALVRSFCEKVHIITGGPGTGKSTITKAILEITRKLTKCISLAAPTGRAAKRLTQITGKKAFTIHSLLEFEPFSKGFKRNKDNPLQCDLIIIDEASMIDTQLMYLLLRAIPDRARVLFIGDIDQLPSVGAGNVLKDMILSEKIGVTHLTEIFRQAKGSQIILNAHKINHGEFPFLNQFEWSDFHYYEVQETEQIQEQIVHLVAHILPEKKKFDPINDIQVLSPMKRGVIGSEMLNFALQTKLNPSNRPFYHAGRRFHLYDKIMQIKNNYNKKIYNGDIGTISQINISEQQVEVCFDQRIVSYEFSELDEIILAYAVSVHKYQGSECPCIVVPVHTSHFKLLHRNLLYTAITRGKKHVVLVGTKKAIAIAIKNEEVKMRYTGLRQAIKDRVMVSIQDSVPSV